jgi:hypothetical protein
LLALLFHFLSSIGNQTFAVVSDDFQVLRIFPVLTGIVEENEVGDDAKERSTLPNKQEAD